MSKILGVVFLIFGTVVGSGFASGKEIMVFFSRFGSLSYLYIALASVLFYLLFYFFLNFGAKVLHKLEKSKLLNIITVIISVVFCASMFAGVESLFSYFPQWLYAILVAILLIACFLALLRGVSGLEKVNLILMPIASVLFLVVLICLCFVKTNSIPFSYSYVGALYCPLYVALNTSMSGFVIAKAGQGMTKKQTKMASLLSSLLIFVFLMIGNFVLLQNPESFVSALPFLYLTSFSKPLFAFAYCVILIGCFTTLISLSFTIKNSMSTKIKNQNFCTAIAVILPFAVSGFGFSQIVSHLYPLCSVVGVLVLIVFVYEGFKNRSNVDISSPKD